MLKLRASNNRFVARLDLKASFLSFRESPAPESWPFFQIEIVEAGCKGNASLLLLKQRSVSSQISTERVPAEGTAVAHREALTQRLESFGPPVLASPEVARLPYEAAAAMWTIRYGMGIDLLGGMRKPPGHFQNSFLTYGKHAKACES